MGLRPAAAAGEAVSTDRMNTGALPLRENPYPPPGSRDTTTSLGRGGERRVAEGRGGERYIRN